MRRLGRDANQRWLAFFIPGIVLVVVAMPINGLARVPITAVAIVFLLMAVIVGGRQHGTCPAGSLPRPLTKPCQRGKVITLVLLPGPLTAERSDVPRWPPGHQFSDSGCYAPARPSSVPFPMGLVPAACPPG